MAVTRRKSGRGASKLIQGSASPQSGITPGTVIAKPKKPFYKRPWFIALVVLFLLSGIFGGGNEEKSSGTTSDSQAEATQTSDDTKSGAADEADSDAADDAKSGTTDSTSKAEDEAGLPEDEAGQLMIDIVAGEPGEYGTLLTMNAGTEFEETKYVYYVPAGRYRIENMDKYPTQASVYQGVHVTEEGWEEPANTGDVVVVGKDSVETITVPEGYYIELAEPSHVLLTLVEPAGGLDVGA